MKKMILGLFFLLCPCWIVWGQQNEQQKRFDILSEKPAQLVFEDNFRHAWSEKWHLDGENAKIIQKDGRLEMYAGGRSLCRCRSLGIVDKRGIQRELENRI